MVNNKKGQTKIQQTAFMIIAITLFFVLVGIFVLGFKFSGLKKSVDDKQKENARLLVSKIANSPEFSCGEAFQKPRTNCVDFDKVLILKENINSYNGFWQVRDIKIIKIEEDQEIECSRENYPNCNTINFIERGVIGTYDSNFVSLCRKEVKDERSYDKCELARIMVSYGGDI